MAVMGAAADSDFCAASALCLACGLCCAGVVHTHAALDPDEIDLARELDLRVDKFEDGLGFHLPCLQYRDGKRAAFHRRPRVCVRYQCELLRRCLEGQANWDESLAIVTQARAMLAALRAQMPGGSTTPITFAMLRQAIDKRQRTSASR
jgi:hypothetical protein